MHGLSFCFIFIFFASFGNFRSVSLSGRYTGQCRERALLKTAAQSYYMVLATAAGLSWSKQEMITDSQSTASNFLS
jgi:hypothetical protein